MPLISSTFLNKFLNAMSLKITILLLPLYFIWIPSFSQLEKSLTVALKEDVTKLDNRIKKQIKKVPCIAEAKDFQIFYIFYLNYNGKFEKEDFLSHSFLKNLEPSYVERKHFFRKDKYLQVHAFISDSIGNLIAQSDGRILHSACKYNTSYSLSEIELQKILYNKEYDLFFNIGFTTGDTYFRVRGNEVYVVEDTNNGLEVYSLEEFIVCCWDSFIATYRKF